MNRNFSFASIAVFSIFLGSQLTEGCLFVPYWKTLSKTAFYNYYAEFGPSINTFYTVLTITAVCIPLSISIYCFFKKAHALKYAIASTLFASLIIVFFYGYFKEVNQQFYQAAYSASQLKSVLNNWAYWHWLRVSFEGISLVFLIQTLCILNKETENKGSNYTKA